MTPEWTDDELRELIKTEFAWNALIEPAQLDVTVTNGVATVFGTVASLAEQSIALDSARSVYGVHDILCEIEVKVAADDERADLELQEMARTVLDWDALVPEKGISVRALDGWITLQGEVPTSRQRDEAARAVAHLTGARGVTNLITLHPSPLKPETIRATIGEALRRRASREASHIDVTVEGHRVNLSGTVQSAREKQALLGAVSHSPGVDVVCDGLMIAGQLETESS